MSESATKKFGPSQTSHFGLTFKFFLLVCTLSGAAGSTTAHCKEKSDFFPDRLVWQTEIGEEALDREFPRRFGLFFNFNVDAGKPNAFSMRATIERKGSDNTVLFQTDEGFPVAITKNDVVLFVSNYRRPQWEEITNAKGRFKFSLSESKGWDLGVFINQEELSGFEVGVSSITSTIKRTHQYCEAPSNSDLLICSQPAKSRFSILQKIHFSQENNDPLLRVSCGNADSRVHILPTGRSADFALDCLSIDSESSRASRQSLIKVSNEASLENIGRYTTSLFKNCADFDAFVISDKFHYSIPRSRSAERAMDLIGDMHSLLGSLQAQQNSADKRAELLKALYNEKLIEILDKFIEIDDVTAVADPLLRTWYAETLFGPLVTSRLRATMFEIAEKKEEPIETRRMAFAGICSIGWTNRYDERLLALRKEFRAPVKSNVKQPNTDVPVGDKLAESDTNLPQNHIHWLLVEGRAGLLVLPSSEKK